MIDKETLNNLINVQQLSYAEIGRLYNVNWRTIKRWAIKLDILLTTQKEKDYGVCLNCGQNLHKAHLKFCSHQCQQNWEQKEWEKRWKEGKETGLKGEYQVSSYLKCYLFKKYNNKCARCGWGETNPYTNKIPLEVEHIDGNYLNNSEENLILLCPNCHSLTATYKGANKGNGRKERKKYTK